MAHSVYGNAIGSTELRHIQTLPAASLSEPIPVPVPVPSAAPADGGWSEVEALSLTDSWSELRRMIGASVLPAFSGGGSPEDALPWKEPWLSRNGFSKIQRSLTFQRSLSNHSLEQLCSPPLRHKKIPVHPFSPSPTEGSLIDFDSPDAISCLLSMRRVFSTGDLQKMSSGHDSGSPSGNESFGNGVQKYSPYNTEEKKERIQRYRSKRNQRNFTKKITYACRKTLADSRPRVRGRFARNEEQGETSHIQWNQIEDDEEESWMNIFDVNYMPIP